jgi:hypothetical protein
MKNSEHIVGAHVRTYLYFDIYPVDGELADDLESYLHEHIVKARALNERVYVGQKDRIFSCDVIRYEIAAANVNNENIATIKAHITEHVNAWVASMGGIDYIN